MNTHYDVIVLGLGGMGSAALSHLARRGARVLGIEQFPPVHNRGSSHGHTRIIRTAYAEHPDYVPLAKRAFANWYDLEQRSGRHLLTTGPCLTVGLPGCELAQGVRTSAQKHNLPYQDLSASELATRYPAMQFPDSFERVQEQNAGYLYVEECVRTYLEDARQAGAVIHGEEPVTAWQARDSQVSVTTQKGTYTAGHLVITAGAWATRLLRDIGVPLSVMRQVLLWFEPRDPSLFRRDRFPIFIAETPRGYFYGLPMIDSRGLKIARHYGAPELASPDEVNWSVTPEDEIAVRAFLDDYFPQQLGRCTHGEVCMYTLTPDRHFVIDRHPEHGNVTVATGFSGHGFKFASVVGEILANLSLTQKTSLPIGFLQANRFRNPQG